MDLRCIPGIDYFDAEAAEVARITRGELGTACGDDTELAQDQGNLGRIDRNRADAELCAPS